MAERITTPDGARLLGRRIADARKNLQISQEKLGQNAGVDRSLISRLESGQFRTLNESVQKVCTTLGLDPRNPANDRMEAIIRRITIMSLDTPRLLTALDGVLDVLESINQGKS